MNDFLILFGPLFSLIYAGLPIITKTQFINRKLKHQQELMQSIVANTLQAAKHVHIEYIYTLCFCFVSMVLCVILHHENRLFESGLPFSYSFLITTTLYVFTDLLAFAIRIHGNYIQGAVLFDSEVKQIYTFPSINSDDYREFLGSELIYTSELYLIGKFCRKTACVFFTKQGMDYAFKVKNLEENNFGTTLSQQKAVYIEIPYKYRFQTHIPMFVTIVLVLLLCNFH